MSELTDFSREVAAFVDAAAPPSLLGTRRGKFDGFWGGRRAQEAPSDLLVWRDRMLARGYTAPTWPKAYGGADLSPDQAKVLDDVLRARGLPPPVVGFGLTMIGPTLLHFGNEAQKKGYLPSIASGAIRWCQGYSEPGAGSDLASLQTRAVRDGDSFVVDGQKIWTSHADKSDWIFCLVRTDPAAKKQAGITFLLVDMQSAGVSTRPIELISGASPFCEVFFEDVRVPAEQVVHEVNKGWTVAKALLGFERSMIGEAMGSQMAAAETELVQLARQHFGPVEGPLAAPELRSAIARNAMDERCFSLTLQRISEQMAAGERPGPESSILKVCASELKQRRFELGVQIAGPDSVGWSGDAFSSEHLEGTRSWLRSRGATIEGGTSEVQLNIIAKHVLELPGTKS